MEAKTHTLSQLARSLRQRLRTHSTTLTRLAAREHAGELALLDAVLTELEDFGDRIEIIEAQLEILFEHRIGARLELQAS